ncbi:MAG: hypothetical protein Kow0037_30030 [Calditrichia bacterium]
MKRKPTEERQREIKQAILHIIAEEGLHALSTRNLAKKVGISEGALFRHFPSKRDMMLAILEDVQTDLMNPLREIAQQNLPAPERLFKFLCTHVRYLIQNRGITILLFSEAAHLNDSELKNRMHDILIHQKQYIGKIIQDGIVAGEWDPELQVENVTMLYMGIPITLSIEMVLNTNWLKTENFCRKMLTLINRALEKK